MMRWWRWLVVGAAAVTLLVWLLNLRGPDEIHDAPPLTPPSGEAVARGAYLARAGNCMACHTARGGVPFAGGRPVETPFGTVYAGNLTPDRDTGLGQWSAAHFWRALHHGRSRDGRLLYPAFPYTHYTRVTRADADALFDYLRSLPPAHQPNRDHQLRWPYGTQWALAVWRALYFRPGSHQPDPQRSAPWNRGAYLVQGLGHCGACHTARDAWGGSADLMDLSGGLIPMQNWYAPSLSAASEAGVREWPLADVVQLLRGGRTERGSALGPMAEVVLHSTQHLAVADIEAMGVYLKDLAPVPGPGERDPREVPQAQAAALARGGQLYGKHCEQCHGERGQGVPGAYPPLAGNRAVLMPVTANLVQVVLYGGFPPATRENPRPFGMPPFAVQLSDADVAAVLTYVRGSWGNRAAPVSQLSVQQQRSSAR